MSVTQEQVQHIAKLCRLDLSEQELAQYTDDLSGILQYVEKLDEIDENILKNITPTFAHTLPLREDIVVCKEDPKDLLKRSPKNIIANQIAIDNIM